MHQPPDAKATMPLNSIGAETWDNVDRHRDCDQALATFPGGAEGEGVFDGGGVTAPIATVARDKELLGE